MRLPPLFWMAEYWFDKTGSVVEYVVAIVVCLIWNAVCIVTLCGENEHVVDHNCSPCPLGTKRAPGDDMDKKNTSCARKSSPPITPVTHANDVHTLYYC